MIANSEGIDFGQEPGDPPALICARVVHARLAPEFDELFSELAELYEEDLSDEIVLNELADFMADLLATGGHEELIERCCALLEELAADRRVDPVASLYDQLLGCLPPSLLDRLAGYLGPLASDLVFRLRGED